MIGWLGMLLPWLVALLVGEIPPSISSTYYTNACATFMIVLGSASFLLMSYKGYEKIDDIINTGAGISGLGICLFPMYADLPRVGTFNLPPQISDILHMVFAVIFFGLLAYSSFFLFTKSNIKPEGKKKIRNIIYRICGIGMLAAFLLMLAPDFYIKVWLVEAIALFFFALSFLTKANCYKWLFCD
jgi:hypothetical protein